MSLPCLECPHESACCNYGSSLTDREAVAIVAAHGSEFVIESEGDKRTAVVDGKCVFCVGNKCMIHGESYYPEVCRGFPVYGLGGIDYPGDKTICPEM